MRCRFILLGVFCLFGGCAEKQNSPPAAAKTVKTPVPFKAPDFASRGVRLPTGPPQPAPKKALEITNSARVAPDHVQQALQRAYEELTRSGNNSDQVRNAVLSIAKDLPEVTVTTGDDVLQWNKLVHCTSNTHFDAFRFKSPLDYPADMFWIFGTPEYTGAWSIVPVNGSTVGFGDYFAEWNLEIPDAETVPGSQFIFQALQGGQILPGQEYIIWHKLPQNEPVPLSLAIRLTSAGKHEIPDSKDPISDVLGLDLRYHQFPKTPEGMRDGLRVAQRLFERKLEGRKAFAQILFMLAPLLPEIRVSLESNKVIWNHVVPPSSSKFHVVRFRSVMAEVGDMHWAFVMPDDLLRWHLVGAFPYGRMMKPFDDYHLEVNAQFDGVSLPSNNLTVLQSHTVGEIIPNFDYYLCFLTATGDLPEIDAAIRLSRPEILPKVVTPQAIAEGIGLKLPDVPAPDRVNACFRRCRKLYDAGHAQTDQFARLLRSVSPVLPALELSDAAVKWNTLNLNTGDVPFAAFKYSSTLEQPADAYLILAQPASQQVAWEFCSGTSKDVVKRQHLSLQDIRLEGLELPEKNVVVFDCLQSGQIPPGSNQLLYFVPTEPTPFTVHAALRLTEPGQHPLPTTAEAVANIVGAKILAPPAP